jgi:hypothetical protein
MMMGRNRGNDEPSAGICCLDRCTERLFVDTSIGRLLSGFLDSPESLWSYLVEARRSYNLPEGRR